MKGDLLDLEKDFFDKIERVSVTQKELEELLKIWERNQSDSDTVYQILQEIHRRGTSIRINGKTVYRETV